MLDDTFEINLLEEFLRWLAKQSYPRIEDEIKIVGYKYVIERYLDEIETKH